MNFNIAVFRTPRLSSLISIEEHDAMINDQAQVSEYLGNIFTLFEYR